MATQLLQQHAPESTTADEGTAAPARRRGLGRLRRMRVDGPPRRVVNAELQALTSLRFFAAFMVFMHHTVGQWNLWDRTQTAAPYFWEGFSGVTFFFILSGFILAYNYWDRLELSGRNGVFTFWTARVARIFPVHLLTFVAAWVLLTPQLRPWDVTLVQGVSAITTLTLTHSFLPSMAMYFSFNAVAWSLSNEMFFYAMFPAIVLLLHKVRHRLTAWKLVAAAVWIWGLGYLVAQALIPLFTPELVHWNFYINPVWRLGDFTIGVLLGIAFLQARTWRAGHVARVAAASDAVEGDDEAIRTRYDNRSFRTARFVAFTVLEVGAIALLVKLILGSQTVALGLRFDSYYVAPMALIIVAFAFQHGLVSKAIAIRPMRFLGEISFSFYMFHFLVLHKVNAQPYFIEHPIRGIGVGFLITLAVSVVSFKLFEGPSRRFIRRRAARIHARNTALRPSDELAATR